MPEPAQTRCPRCGALRRAGEPCCSDACSTNRATQRPSPSRPHGKAPECNSGAFQVHSNPRTTLRELARECGDAEPEEPGRIPAQSRVPCFPENDVDDPDDLDR